MGVPKAKEEKIFKENSVSEGLCNKRWDAVGIPRKAACLNVSDD